MLDISPRQLGLAKQKLTEANVLDSVEQVVEGDIIDLPRFPSNHFDAVLCLGGALSYVCEHRHKAAKELARVTKQGGTIVVSVMSWLGATLGVVRWPETRYLLDPDDVILIYLEGHLSTTCWRQVTCEGSSLVPESRTCRCICTQQ